MTIPIARLMGSGLSIGGAVGAVAVTTVVIAVLTRLLPLAHVSIVYLIPVLFAAVRWGTVASVTAALASVGASAFFFYAPLYDLRVDDPQQIVDLILFVVVALVTSRLATALRHNVGELHDREILVSQLYALSQRLAAATSASEIYRAIEEHLSMLLQHEVVLVQPGGEPDERFPDAVRARVVALLQASSDDGDEAVVLGPSGAWIVLPVSRAHREYGVVTIDVGGHPEDADLVRQRIVAALRYAEATLDRLGVADAITDARVRTGSQTLRDALIGSVSHDLKTPLAAITGAATVLCSAGPVAADQRLAGLSATIRDEADRLNVEIQNLLDASRISSEGLQPRPQWIDPTDVVNAALARLTRRLADHSVDVVIAPDLPLIQADAALLAQAFGQVLDNAAKYAPAGSPIAVTVSHGADGVTLTVADQGIGWTEDELAHLGERFYRGERHAAAVPGTGLGLWIATAFVTANGGSLVVDSRGRGMGSTVRILIPADKCTAATELTASHG